MSAFIVLPEPMFNRLIMSEWLNADEREINEATEIWQKHRNIKSVGKSTENVGVLQEPIEETMKKLRNFLDFINCDLLKFPTGRILTRMPLILENKKT